MKKANLFKTGAGLVALALAGCAGNYTEKPKGLFSIPAKRAEELKSLPGYQLSDVELCQLAEQNHGNYKTNRKDLARASLGEEFALDNEKVQPCHISSVYPGRQLTDMIFFVQKPNANITYKFNQDNGVIRVDVKTGSNGFEKAESFYPGDKEAMDLAGRKIKSYLEIIEKHRQERVDAEKQRKKDVLKLLE